MNRLMNWRDSVSKYLLLNEVKIMSHMTGRVKNKCYSENLKHDKHYLHYFCKILLRDSVAHRECVNLLIGQIKEMSQFY